MVFVPLIATTGVTGVFFRALAITVSVSLLTSLALALSWTPTLSQYFIRERKDHDIGPRTMSEASGLLAAEEASLTGRFRKIVNFYERWLRFALERPRWIAVFGVILIVASYFCYKALGTDLLPAMDEGGFVVDYIMPPGSSLQETNRVINHVEEMVREIPEVEGYSRRTGLQLGLAAVTEANTGDIAVKLKTKRSRSVDDIISDLRAEIKEGGARHGCRVRPGTAGHDRRPVECA